jgi:hypothetical protein
LFLLQSWSSIEMVMRMPTQYNAALFE